MDAEALRATEAMVAAAEAEVAVVAEEEEEEEEVEVRGQTRCGQSDSWTRRVSSK